VRIFQKELKSLAKEYEAYFIVADGLGNDTKDNVRIIDIGLRSQSRLKRAIRDSKKALQKALEIECDLYHLHDPELLKVGLRLKKEKKKVVFDAHEDLPQQILTKEYIPKSVRKVVSIYYKFYEARVSKKLDAVVAATPTIANKFNGYGAHAITVCNYPIAEIRPSNYSINKNLVYIGGISDSRGLLTMLEAIKSTNYKLNLAGKFFNKEIEQEAKLHPAWSQVNWLGFLDSKEVKSILSDSSIGLVVLKPFKSYKESLPVKMFEYMNAGIPYIASKFSIWENITNKHNCGICVDPLSLDEIAKAINELYNNPEKAKKMGMNGQKAIETEYNWDKEKIKLFELYEALA
jgi:glycosyltransferase involved in cell wall biosynthesis